MSLSVEVVLGPLTSVEVLQPTPYAIELTLTQPGPMGPQGPKGDTGATGAQGDKGHKGDPGDVASESAIRAIAADQDTVQVYDFDALVATNLGV